MTSKPLFQNHSRVFNLCWTFSTTRRKHLKEWKNHCKSTSKKSRNIFEAIERVEHSKSRDMCRPGIEPGSHSFSQSAFSHWNNGGNSREPCELPLHQASVAQSGAAQPRLASTLDAGGGTHTSTRDQRGSVAGADGQWKTKNRLRGFVKAYSLVF